MFQSVLSRIALFSCVALCTWQANTKMHGDEPKPSNLVMMPEVQLNITPAAEVSPPLRYSLTYPANQRKPGNGASFYYRAMLLQASQADKDFEVAAKWRDMPLDQLPKDEVRRWLATQQRVLDELRTAATREYCDWDLRPQDLTGMKTIAFLLPEAQSARRLAMILRIQTRLALTEKKFDEAVNTLRDGYQMARDITQTPYLITSLVGVSIATMMNESVQEFIATSGSPNLYWALAMLPQPLIDFRSGFEFEMNLPFQMFPILATAETAQHSPEEWRRLFQESVRKIFAEMANLTEGTKKGIADDLPNALKDVAKEALFQTAMLLAYPKAKQALIQSGMDAKRVDEMPYEQVIIIQSARECRTGYQELFKCLLVPYSQFPQAAKEAEAKLKAEGYFEQPFSKRGAISIIPLLMPAAKFRGETAAALDRDFAALRNLEAIRIHAALHNGALPKTLEEIKAVPVLLNPATGTSFPYRLEGPKATMDVPSIGHRKGKVFTLQLATEKHDG